MEGLYLIIAQLVWDLFSGKLKRAKQCSMEKAEEARGRSEDGAD